MGLTPLRLALAAWLRHPREMAVLNGAWMLAVALPLPVAMLLPSGPLRWLILALALAWAWFGSGLLAAGCAQVLFGDGLRLSGLVAWARRHALERLAALGLGAAGALWVAIAVRFYLALGATRWFGLALLALVVVLGTWLLLALLASIGVAALGARDRRGEWKAAALMPLAFWPSWIGAALLGLLLSGAPALLFGPKSWPAAVFMAPLLLSPFFTAAFYAAYLVVLSQSLLERAAGREAPAAPDWRELWSPWR